LKLGIILFQKYKLCQVSHFFTLYQFDRHACTNRNRTEHSTTLRCRPAHVDEWLMQCTRPPCAL